MGKHEKCVIKNEYGDFQIFTFKQALGSFWVSVNIIKAKQE